MKDADCLLESIKSSPHCFNLISKLLLDWIHVERASEIDDHLIHAILFLDRELTLKILLQLKEPQSLLRNVSTSIPKEKSFTLHTKLSSPDGHITALDNSALLDCGAGGCGYISKSYTKSMGFSCTPLPYHIPVYNVNGTLNKVLLNSFALLPCPMAITQSTLIFGWRTQALPI